MTSVANQELPEFRRPPLHEVALTVGFDAMPGLRAIELGSLRVAWETDYPQLDEQPALPPEQQDEPSIVVRFGVVPLQRQLFGSADGRRLLQVQDDRMILNWRRVDDQPYPRYGELAPELDRRLADVGELAVARSGSGLTARWVEATYVNLVTDGLDRPRVDEVLLGLTPLGDSPLGHPDVQVGYRWPPVGPERLALSVLAQSTAAPGGTPAVLLNLTVRGQVSEGSPYRDTLDRTHEHLVSAFTALTTTSMHERWERAR